MDSEPTGDRHREAHVTTEFPQPGGFQDFLNEEFPETTALDATAVHIREFLTKEARQADAARQEFEQVDNSLTPIDGHDRHFFNELLCSLVTSPIFVRC